MRTYRLDSRYKRAHQIAIYMSTLSPVGHVCDPCYIRSAGKPNNPAICDPLCDFRNNRPIRYSAPAGEYGYVLLMVPDHASGRCDNEAKKYL